MKPLLFFATLFLVLPPLLHAGPPPRLQAKVKGLLVVELPNGKTAGTASQMNATAMPSGENRMKIGFNQDVGESMDAAVAEVSKFIAVRYHQRMPEGYRIELAFAEKYSEKDGPSAAVATALLVDSLLADNELADDFAVTGDMNADGAVQPVGGVISKIRGARLKGCALVGIPQQNENAVSDSYLTEGLREIRSIQIFSVATFDEAHAVASASRGDGLATAISEFTKVQQVLERDERLIFNPKVIGKLQEILKAAPNHLSAKYLILHGLKRGPRNLSLIGSLGAIDEADTAFAAMLNDGSFTETSGNSDVLFKFEGEMGRLRPLLDKRTVAYCDTYISLAEFIKANRGKRIYTAQIDREFKAAIAAVRKARTDVLSDAEIREELMLLE